MTEPAPAASPATPAPPGSATSDLPRPASPPSPLAAPVQGPCALPPYTAVIDGHLLRRRRRQRGLSIDDLAHQAGVGITTLDGSNARPAPAAARPPSPGSPSSSRRPLGHRPARAAGQERAAPPPAAAALTSANDCEIPANDCTPPPSGI